MNLLERYLSQVMRHDDSMNDRSEGSRLMNGEALVRKFWQHHFPNDSYWRRGAMYRGHLAPCM